MQLVTTTHTTATEAPHPTACYRTHIQYLVRYRPANLPQLLQRPQAVTYASVQHQHSVGHHSSHWQPFEQFEGAAVEGAELAEGGGDAAAFGAEAVDLEGGWVCVRGWGRGCVCVCVCSGM